jgi:hypothetical protein
MLMADKGSQFRIMHAETSSLRAISFRHPRATRKSAVEPATKGAREIFSILIQNER